MNFVDRSGHIFSLPSYDTYPIGYEYNESPYIFWFDTERGYKLSVNNYYFKPIRFITKLRDIDSISINIKIEDSNKFYLIDSDIIENELLNAKNINSEIKIFESSITSSKELSYIEEININDLENSNFKGAIVDESDEENPIILVDEEYYINTLSNDEYDGEIITWDSLNEDYMSSDGELHSKDEVSQDTLFGKIEIGLVKKEIYIIVERRIRSIEKEKAKEERIIQDSERVKRDLYLINTFYVVINSDEAGVWSTNVLINVNDDWCPITVAGEVIDESEELIINGQNIGLKLPKEIVQAIYSSNYNSFISDEKTYYNKLKEYLLNFMSLKGEMGNYRSVLLGLKWFEWGDKLSISKLLRNDNRVQKQYIKDFFEITNDTLYSYQLFKNTSLISLTLNLDQDTDQDKQYVNDTENHFFWGEGKNITHNIFNDVKEVRYDEKEYPYLRGYFDFTFNDLGLKLAALKYYYETYFLPLYIRVHKIYMNKHVYSNDIKYITKTSNGITASPVFFSTYNEIIDPITHKVKDIVFNNNYDIVFFNRNYKKNTSHNEFAQEPEYIEYDGNGNPMIYNLLYVDTNFNEFSHYTKEYVDASKDTFYEVNETSLRIPISFPHNDGSYEYYNVSLILSKYINHYNENIIDSNSETNLKELLSTQFSFIQTDSRKYESFLIYPKLINELNENKFDYNYWLNNTFRIDLIVNNKLYNFVFKAKMPEFNIELGRLIYKYDSELFKQKSIEYLEGIDENGNQRHRTKYNAYMYLPNLVNVNNIDFDYDILEFSNNLIDYINSNYKESVKFLNKKYLNTCHLFELCNTDNKPIKYQYFNSNIKDNYFNSVSYNDEMIFFYDINGEEKLSININKLIKLKDTSKILDISIMNDINDMYYLNIKEDYKEIRNHIFYLDDLYNKYFYKNIPTISWDGLQLFIDENNSNDELYDAFFKDYKDEETGEFKYDYNFDKNILNINNHKYDLYLMHDFSRWYVILISKECIDYKNENEKKFKFNNGKKDITIGNYKLKYSRSDRKFLLNRYYYEPVNGVNHFSKDDIIVSSLKNNDKLSLKLAYGTKWQVSPISLGMKNVNPVTSNSELAIISIPDKYVEYQRGYYSLSITYSVDDYINHTYNKKVQFRID